jgi:hypothetical protein
MKGREVQTVVALIVADYYRFHLGHAVQVLDRERSSIRKEIQSVLH